AAAGLRPDRTPGAACRRWNTRPPPPAAGSPARLPTGAIHASSRIHALPRTGAGYYDVRKCPAGVRVTFPPAGVRVTFLPTGVRVTFLPDLCMPGLYGGK